MAVPEKRCLYEVLGLPTDCSADEIWSAYKCLALKRHPDKLIQSDPSPGDATASFQELVNTYEVLSNPRERSWYDTQRSQILFSNPTTTSHSPSLIPNLFLFFSNSVYSSFSDSGKGFSLNAFYDYWLRFVTVMHFCRVDQYDVMAGVNRKLRRVIEDENKKLRKKERREFHEKVHGLAEFVRKSDKQVIDMMVKKEAELERRKAEERQRKR